MTDWDKELAKIDKQLASISDEQLMASAAPQPATAAKGATKTLAAPASANAARPAAAAPSAGVTAGRPWFAWLKVTVAVAAAAGLMFWPWPARCGLPLIGFTASTGGVALLGLWSAIGTWRHRLGLAHVASLLVTIWGLALGAREVLPRVGYAIPTTDRPAVWSCDGLPALPLAPASTAPTNTTPETVPPGTTPADPNTVPPTSPSTSPDGSSGTSFPG
ncbi:MAG: hypothetical protein IBJ03_03960 [Gemmatimonadaceae bacterium]|nr:hypothetical protein [Gemmatimonadaceae bacterium]